MVRAFHAAGHRGLAGRRLQPHERGRRERPDLLASAGIDNHSYYLLAGRRLVRQRHAAPATRCRTGHPAVRSLVSWQPRALGRPDAASTASVSTWPRSSPAPPTAGSIRDPSLIAEISSLAGDRDLRLVAEAWDVAAYQLGRGFPGITWRQWNGKFRDDVRGFVKGDPGMVAALMTRLYGSDDLFPDGLRRLPALAERQLRDRPRRVLPLRSRLLRPQAQRGERPRQHRRHRRQPELELRLGGGRGRAGEVLALRRRQVRNFGCLLMLANGTPMFVAGDEFLHTQGGNNNPYNQDNETTWLDWTKLEANGDLLRFCAPDDRLPEGASVPGPLALLARRRALARDRRAGRPGPGEPGPGLVPRRPRHRGRRPLRDGQRGLGAGVVPVAEPGPWRRVADTSLPSPDDIVDPSAEPLVPGDRYAVGSRSVVVLLRRRVERPA